MTVGEKIKMQRKFLGLTQTELGKQLGVQKNAVSKWETGRVDDISGAKIKAMATIFGVNPSYLIDEDDECIPTDSLIHAILIEAQSLTEQNKYALLDLARQLKATECDQF